MNRETCKKLLISGVFEAFATGKAVQYRHNRTANSPWIDESIALAFNDNCDYRVKPDPPYRPFSPEEAAIKLFGKLVTAKSGSQYKVYLLNTEGQIIINRGTMGSGVSDWESIQLNLKDLLFQGFTFDGEPCGVRLS